MVVPASDDPPLLSRSYQEELRTFSNALSAHGVIVSKRFYMQDAVGGGGHC